jgi:hypothetical protein
MSCPPPAKVREDLKVFKARKEFKARKAIPARTERKDIRVCPVPEAQ